MDLPGAAVEVVERRGRRYYRFAGEEELYPSVTTILQLLHKPAIAPWMVSVAASAARAFLLAHEGTPITPRLVDEAEQVMRSARNPALDHGAAVHDAIHALLSGRPHARQHDAQVMAFRAWLEAEHLRPVATELRLASKRLGIGGAIDLVAEDRGGRPVLVDWKTSAAVYPEYHYQLGAYALLWRDTTGEHPAAAWCVRYGREDGVLEAVSVPDLREAGEVFLRLLELYRAHNSYVSRLHRRGRTP